MVTCLHSYRESSDKNRSVKYSVSKGSLSAEVITLHTKDNKKEKARAKLLKAASKIHW